MGNVPLLCSRSLTAPARLKSICIFIDAARVGFFAAGEITAASRGRLTATFLPPCLLVDHPYTTSAKTLGFLPPHLDLILHVIPYSSTNPGNTICFYATPPPSPHCGRHSWMVPCPNIPTPFASALSLSSPRPLLVFLPPLDFRNEIGACDGPQKNVWSTYLS